MSGKWAQMRATAELAKERPALMDDYLLVKVDDVLDLLAERDAPLADLDAAREALRPFAEAAESLDDWHRDRGHIWETAAAMAIEAGHLRAARTALARLEGKP